MRYIRKHDKQHTLAEAHGKLVMAWAGLNIKRGRFHCQSDDYDERSE